mgnify:FL=1
MQHTINAPQPHTCRCAHSVSNASSVRTRRAGRTRGLETHKHTFPQPLHSLAATSALSHPSTTRVTQHLPTIRPGQALLPRHVVQATIAKEALWVKASKRTWHQHRSSQLSQPRCACWSGTASVSTWQPSHVHQQASRRVGEEGSSSSAIRSLLQLIYNASHPLFPASFHML